MNRISLLPLLIYAFVGTSAIAQSPPVIYSPWTKFCLKDGGGTTCFVARDARTACDVGVTIASVVLVKRDGEASATLRMTLPPAANRDQEARITIDQDESISRPFKECDAHSCTVEYQAPAPDLAARLKSGRTLAVRGVDAGNRPLTSAFPLAGFTEAYDGPASVSKVFEARESELQAELERRQKAAGEVRKPEGC